MNSYHYTDEDRMRFRPQELRLIQALRLGEWESLESIAQRAGFKHPSTCASRLRDLKARGSHSYERRRVTTGEIWQYRINVCGPTGQLNLIEVLDDSNQTHTA